MDYASEMRLTMGKLILGNPYQLIPKSVET